VIVIDGFMPDAEKYRTAALARPYATYDLGGEIWHGISLVAPGDPAYELPLAIQRYNPDFCPTLSFFRRSPEGQVEPNFIHTDVDMGEWTGILYLNPRCPEGDGTAFWTHRATQETSNRKAHLRSQDGQDHTKWDFRLRVQSKFNRLLLFQSQYYHSRSIFENWGNKVEARLIQVVFGTGSF